MLQTTAYLLLDHMPPSDSLAGFTIVKKEMCLGIVSACRVDPAVALRLKKVADYHLPTFGSNGTKIGHS